jgi:fucose permease
MSRAARVLLLLAYLAFISIGLPDTVLGVAWPSLRQAFGISQSAMGAVLAAGVTGYFLSGLLAGLLVRKMGVGGLLSASSGLVALALVGYAAAPSWSSFFPVGLLMGFGSGAIDSGLNGYAARNFSVRHINWLHACWGVGASTGPVIMTAAIARGLGYGVGYACLACLLAVMSLAFVATRRSWDEGASRGAPAPAVQGDEETSFGAALTKGRVWLLIGVFFVYTGLESSVGQWCFSLLREGRGLSIEAAGSWTAAYWGSLTLGRVALGFIVDRFGPDRLLRAASVCVLAGALLFAWSDGAAGRIGLLVMGLSLAPMFPTLMARTPARVGAGVARHSVGFQVSASTLGSSVVPAAIGILVGRVGLGAISIVVLVMGATLLIVHELLLRSTRQVGGHDITGLGALPQDEELP